MLTATVPSWGDIDALANHRGPACVSLFLPTTPVSTKADESRLLYKNLVREALVELAARGVAPRAVTHLDTQLNMLSDDATFWANQRHGLAVFASDDVLTAWTLNHRPTPAIFVGDRFMITPLVTDVSAGGDALVLALSQNEARLLEVTPGGAVRRLEIEGMPADLVEVAGQRSDVDRSMSAIEGREGQKVRMSRYAHAVDAAIGHHLAPSNGAMPLILAAAQPLDGLFRAENRYPHLHPISIQGSPDNLTDGELAESALGILLANRREHLARLNDDFRASEAQKLGSSDVEYVARAATAGAIRILLVNEHVRMAGAIDEIGGAVTWSPECGEGCYDVIDEIVRRTLASGGEVFVGEPDDVPDQAPVAAILRYEL